mgnify:CR=1 FL=1
MNNYRNNRKSRFKTNGDRNFRKRSSNGHKNQSDFTSNSDFRHRNPGRNNQNAAKLVDKYNNLAREALSSGDKILSENYLQHADHFTRILNEREAIKKEKIEEKKENFSNNISEINLSSASVQ